MNWPPKIIQPLDSHLSLSINTFLSVLLTAREWRGCFLATFQLHPFTPAAVAWPAVCAPFVRAQERAQDLVRLVSSFLPSCLPMCCKRTLCTGSLSIVSLRNCQLALSPFSFRLTSHESLPTCFLCVLPSASLKFLGFMLLFYFLLFISFLNSISLLVRSHQSCLLLS